MLTIYTKDWCGYCNMAYDPSLSFKDSDPADCYAG